MSTLPNEVWRLIIENLPANDVFTILRVNRNMNQLAQSTAVKRSTEILQRPRYQSKKAIKRNLNLVMTLVQRRILPDSHQQLWILEEVLLSENFESIEIIKLHFTLIPEMYHICIRLIQVQNYPVKRIAAEFMLYLDSKGIPFGRLHELVKGKTIDEVIDIWYPIDKEASIGLHELVGSNYLKGCKMLLSQHDILDLLGNRVDKQRVSTSENPHWPSVRPIDVNRQNFCARSPCTDAAKKKDSAILDLLLSQPGCDINQILSSGKPGILSAAVLNDRMDNVKLLISKIGIDINQNSFYGNDALHIAIDRNNMDMVKLLLDHPRVDVNVVNNNLTPLIHACREGRIDVFKLLIRHPDIKYNPGEMLKYADLKETFQFFFNHPAFDLCRLMESGKEEFLLVKAAEAGCVDSIKFLLNHPLHDQNNRTELIRKAFAQACLTKRRDVVAYLLDEHGADVNCIDKGGSDHPVIILATSEDDTSVLELLLSHPAGIDVNQVNQDGETALLFATRARRTASVALLLQHPDIDVNYRDHRKRTPLILALSEGNLETAFLILKHPRLNVNLTQGDGKSALHVVASYSDRYTLFLRALLQHPEIDVNLLDNDNRTACTIAHSKSNRVFRDLILYHPTNKLKESMMKY